jgi:predicted Zn-dependent protease
MGRFEEAELGIAGLSERSPKSIDVIHLRAKLALEQGEPQAAREILQGHEAALRTDLSMQATYGTALLRAGQAGLARVWLEPVVEAFPNRREVRTLLAEAELAAGDPARALATIRPLAERPDARPEELKIAAQAAANAGDSSAERYAARTKLTTPEWIGGELAKADTALRNQQWAKAVQSYEAIDARSKTPNAMVLNNLAYAKAKLGQSDEAVQIAMRAVELAPDHPAILDTAGWLLVKTGKDRKRGISLLEQASKLDPDNTSIARNLAAAKRS